MNLDAYYKRVLDVLHPQKLAGKKAIVVGLGSGGSRVAIELGRAGVELWLIDRPNECVEEHNIIRYPLGYDALGQAKNRAVSSHIRNLNPSTQVTAIDLDVVAGKEQFAEMVSNLNPQVILVCVDNETAKHVVNEVAVGYGIPQVGAGVGGEITIMHSRGLCYACMADHLQLARHAPAKARSIDYNNLNIDEIRSTCALNLDIEQLALIQARVGLHILLAGDPDLIGVPGTANLWVFCNRPVPGDPVLSRPLHCEFFSVPRNPDCLVCGSTAQGVDSEAVRIIRSLETVAPPEGDTSSA